MERSLLDILQKQHNDNFGWALACSAWQRQLAEDVLQEAYLRVIDGRAIFSGRATERTWFFAVIKRVAAEQQRGQARRSIFKLRLVREHQGLVEGQAQSAEDECYRDQSARHLQHCLLELSERQRETLHLVFYGELTLEEAADTLEISLGSARTHYHRGKERLAKLLGLDESHEH